VTAQACPLFVPLAEEGWTDPGDEVVRLVARRYLTPVRAAGVDVVVLVDSAAAIAAEVRERFPTAASGGPAVHEFLVTDTPDRFLQVAPRFLGRPVESARHVDV